MREVIEHLLFQGRLTIAEFEALCPETNRRTLQRDLKPMLDKGLLEKVGAGPTDPTRYYKILELWQAMTSAVTMMLSVEEK